VNAPAKQFSPVGCGLVPAGAAAHADCCDDKAAAGCTAEAPGCPAPAHDSPLDDTAALWTLLLSSWCFAMVTWRLSSLCLCNRWDRVVDVTAQSN